MSAILQYLKQERGFPTVEAEVFIGLQIAADRLAEPWERILKERADLTMVQYNVLRILQGAGANGIRASDIADRLITRSPDVTRIVDRLEKRGFVCRRPDPGDRRAVVVLITELGRERIAPFPRLAREVVKETLGHLGEDRLLALRDALNDILLGLKQK